MLIYPAIDLIEGCCVRLLRGEFEDATYYDISPAEALQTYESAGAKWVHLVDLDGAKAGAPRQHDFLGEFAGVSGLNLQMAGGVRERTDIVKLLNAGAARVVVGSRAVEDPDAVCRWLEEFGADRITLAFDIRMIDQRPWVALKGWRETSPLTLFDLLERFPDGTARNVLITNIARDGAMSGPDIRLYEQVIARRPDLALQASGGVRSVDDISALAGIGCAGAIIGRALFEKRIDLGEAINAGA